MNDNFITIKEIKENLCFFDTRNPEFSLDCILTPEEIQEEGYGPHAKQKCLCDNCFYGRTFLAEELLKLHKKIKDLQGN